MSFNLSEGEYEDSPENSRRKIDTSAVSMSGDEYEDSDSLAIRPPQASHSSKHKRREHHGRSHRDRHRDKKHSHHHRFNDYGPTKNSHKMSDKYRHSYAERGYKEKKSDLLDSRHSYSCKYDSKKAKDSRNSHRDSESHRRYERDIKVAQDLNRESGSFDDRCVHGEFEDEDRYKRESKRSSEPELAELSAESAEIDEEDVKEEIGEEGDVSSGSKRKLEEEGDEELLSKYARLDEDASPKGDGREFSDLSEERTVSLEMRSGSGSSEKLGPVSPLDEQLDEVVGDEDKPKIDESLPPYLPAIEGCRSVEEFQCLNRIEEGTYGVVYRFRDKRTDDIVALKKLKMEKEREGFPITSLREINTLLKSQHPNIVTVREIVVGSNMDKIFIVMDYVEHDLKSLIELMRNKNQKFMPGEVKCLLKQLLTAVAHLHDNWILHRDLKTSNLLLSHKGILKVGDFGLAREYGSPLKQYTPIVVTLWYRAPELLLGAKEYSTPIDMWSVGCIFAEFLLMHAMFSGKSEVEQINRIFRVLGTPTEKIWPGYSKLPAVQKVKFANNPPSNLRKKFQMLSDFGLNLLTLFLTYDPVTRVTAEEALKHPYFTEFPAPIDPSQFPKWPAKSELGQKRASSPKPPSGGEEYKKLAGDQDGFRMGLEADNSRMGAGFNLKF